MASRPARLAYVAIALLLVAPWPAPALAGRQAAGEDSETGTQPGGSTRLPRSEHRVRSDTHSGSDPDSGSDADAEMCRGRRIHILDLGSRFHKRLLFGKDEKDPHGARNTAFNGGYGPLSSSSFAAEPAGPLRKMSELPSKEDVSPAAAHRRRRWPWLDATWYDTWHVGLDVIFHARMLSYPCLTPDPNAADFVYVLFYGSVDMSRHMTEDNEQRSQLGRELAAELAQTPRFQMRQGRDHFVVLGRPVWDYYANFTLFPGCCFWGTDLLRQDSLRNVHWISVERSIWIPHVLSVPYPTTFHPPGAGELQRWMKFVSRSKRPWLFAFAGAHRGPEIKASSMRDSVMWQCAQSSRCNMLDCGSGVCKRNPRAVFDLYMSASFCIHPPGDSCTRRAVLDSMLAGCIPVHLAPCMLKDQYGWLFGNTTECSVFVDGRLLKGEQQEGATTENEKDKTILLEESLSKISTKEVERMRRKLMSFIPRITYGGSPVTSTKAHVQKTSISPPDFQDAFDYALKEVMSMMMTALQSDADR